MSNFIEDITKSNASPVIEGLLFSLFKDNCSLGRYNFSYYMHVFM